MLVFSALWKGDTHISEGNLKGKNCENTLRNRNTLGSMSYQKYFKTQYKKYTFPST